MSEVALGGWLTQGRTLADSDTKAIVHRAFDLGVNFFDTADVYHAGAAETALGASIKDFRRSDLVIATKCFFPMTDRPNDRGLSRKHIVESVHASLHRLGTDYVDVMQCHRFDPETPLDETVRVFEDLIRQGKVLYWGVSQWRAHDIVDAVRLADQFGAYRPISNQPIYNIFERGIETDVIPACTQHGLSQVVFSPLAQGVLTGKYVPGQVAPQGSRGADETSNTFMGGYMEPHRLEQVQAFKRYAESLGCSAAQLALAWCLRQPNLASVIIGATKLSQLEDNVAAAGKSFGEDVWTHVDTIFGVGA